MKPHPLKDPIAYEAWFKALTPGERDRECRRVYTQTEYLLNQLDEHEDSLEITGCFPTKPEALRAMWCLELRPDATWAEVEKCVTKIRGGDLDVMGKEYTTIIRSKR